MAQYLWLMPIALMPPTALGWAIIAPVQLALARRTASRPLRLLVAVSALVGFVFLTSVFCAAWLRESFSPGDLLAMSSMSSYVIFGLAVPWLFITGRSLRDQTETWWQASLLAAGAVLTGAIIWIVFGDQLWV